jgi:hypothetical protein
MNKLDDLFDIIILTEKSTDLSKIKKQVEYTKKNIIGYRNIYIVSDDIYLIENSITTKLFPFSEKDIENMIGPSEKCYLYLVQLIKLYAGFIIPDILHSYLVIDSNTFFLRPTRFIKNELYYFNVGNSTFYLPYFTHMNYLHPSLNRYYSNCSWITHHIIFDKKYIQELFDLVSNQHDNKPFWKIFIEELKNPNTESSEYEIYVNFMLKYHYDKTMIRDLHWKTISYNENIDNITNLHYVYCS